MPYQLTQFHCYTFFPSQDIKQNVLLRQLMRLFIFDHPLSQWPTEKRGEDKNA